MRQLKAEVEMLKIGLGAQLAEQHKEFKELALMAPDIAEAWYILSEIPRLITKEPFDFILELLKDIGKVESFQMPSWNEVSRLSMVVGDTRPSFRVKPKNV
jgi:hypothetical protein